MYKAKLMSFALACLVGIAGLSPITTLAAVTETESVTLSEKEHQGKRTSFEEKMQDAYEKWNTLTDKQKKEVYDLLGNDLKAEMKILDKLVKLQVMQKEDVEDFKTLMQKKYQEIRESGEFPFYRPRNQKKQ